MSTSAAAAAAAGTVQLYCQDCSARFSLPAPSSPFDLTLCPRCRRGYLDDRPAPYLLPPSAPLRPPPPPLWPSPPSSPSAMLPPPPPPHLWIPSSSASSSSPTKLPPTPLSPCTRASSSSTGLPPPLPSTMSSGTTTSSAARVPYYCPKHFAVATCKEPPFPLSTLQRCPNCRVHDFHEDAERPLSSSFSTISPISSAYSSASSSPLWLPPPPPPELYQGELQPGSPPLTMERVDFADDNVEVQPAPTAWITRLPVITVADNEVLCAHCTNPILRRGRRLPCGHQYHASCIMPWLSRRNSCPVWDCQCSLQGSPPPSPPSAPSPPSSLPLDYFFGPFLGPSPSLTSMPSNTWDYFFGPSTEERAPQHHSGLQSAARTLPPLPLPVSIHASPIDSPVHCGGSQVAPTTSIVALPTVTVSDTTEVCAVCMEPLLLEAATRRLPCGHLYHLDCIMSWLSRHNSCPVCRRSIPMFPSTTAVTALPPPLPVSIYASQAALAVSIAALPIVTVSDTAEVCAVCTEPLPLVAAARRLLCGHLYHSDCIVSWLSRHNSCPVCRCSIPMFPSTTAVTALPPPPPVSISDSQAAPAASIAALPTVTVFDTAEVCAVCTEPLPLTAAVRRLLCGHLYHSDCIVSWLSRHNSCPVCLLSIPMFPSTTAEIAPLPVPPVSIDASLIDSPVHPGGSQAAPAASIAALPTVTVSDTAEVCAVCTEPLPLAATARRLLCGHLYHSDCIVSWLSWHNSCPVCRCSIPMFPSPTAETVPSPSLPQPTPGRRRSLPGARRIRRICHRLLRYMEISRARQPNRSGNIVHG